MNLQPVDRMYSVPTRHFCKACGEPCWSHEMVVDRDNDTENAPARYCLFCADPLDPVARKRQSEGAAVQWARMTPTQQARAKKFLGIV